MVLDLYFCREIQDVVSCDLKNALTGCAAPLRGQSLVHGLYEVCMSLAGAIFPATYCMVSAVLGIRTTVAWNQSGCKYCAEPHRSA
jgi:hypothetical protein